MANIVMFLIVSVVKPFEGGAFAHESIYCCREKVYVLGDEVLDDLVARNFHCCLGSTLALLYNICFCIGLPLFDFSSEVRPIGAGLLVARLFREGRETGNGNIKAHEARFSVDRDVERSDTRMDGADFEWFQVNVFFGCHEASVRSKGTESGE